MQTGGIAVSARHIQRGIQRIGGKAQQWQERQSAPGDCAAPVLYVSADGTARTRQDYPGCVFTQHRTDEQGHPVRDYESTTCVSSFQSIDEFGPLLRQEALGCGLGGDSQVLLLMDGASGLENMGRLCFKDCVQIVDFYHAMEHAGHVLEAWLGKAHPECRSKQSGMFRSKSGAENILALRCIHSSRRLEDFWKYRLNQHAARNDTLPLAA